MSKSEIEALRRVGEYVLLSGFLGLILDDFVVWFLELNLLYGVFGLLLFEFSDMGFEFFVGKLSAVVVKCEFESDLDN